MAQIPTYEFIVGTTKRLTWVNTGVTAGFIHAALRDFNGTLINSITGVDSGNGHYYAVMPHPNTPGWYSQEWVAIINANTYVSKQYGFGRALEVT
jgi:hypothetical protein